MIDNFDAMLPVRLKVGIPTGNILKILTLKLMRFIKNQ